MRTRDEENSVRHVGGRVPEVSSAVACRKVGAMRGRRSATSRTSMNASCRHCCSDDRCVSCRRLGSLWGAAGCGTGKWVCEAGYDNARLTLRGLARADDDPFGLPRVHVHCGTNILRFLQKCLTRREDKRGYWP
ncbi:hypothetical protein CBM2605_B100373 [Cupriavidus neocaledonicus]|uniref:Uncharacterized protein n=1 Tax=Cupriavidus neocaledonicus TaxID=1040979 RepID=A0ABY1V6V5_9BURK|nr:hypothetical protein CBM2605_B100373 [Cupriavidus neocaledonicus]